MRERLIKILRVPIFPHELVDPTEAVADYLLDNNVVPVVRCKDCKHYHARGNQANSVKWDCKKLMCCRSANMSVKPDDFCSYGERREGE